MTREELREIGVGERSTFYGTFSDQWRWKFFHEHRKKMFLLADIRDHAWRRVTDHLWFYESETFSKLNLKSGDVIKFRATVVKYRKLVRSEYDIRGERFVVEDYKLAYAKDVEKIPDPSRPMVDSGQTTLEALIYSS